MREIRRAANRFVTEQPGITTWHSFSAGAHYDPDNIAFGPLIGCDEHLVAPAAGFDWHAHRGVVIISWILEGVLHHEDSNGTERFVVPGSSLVQSTGAGIRHRETNASASEPLRLVQSTILAPADVPSVWVGDANVSVAGVEFSALTSCRFGGGLALAALVTQGCFDGDNDPLYAGDSVRLTDGESVDFGGTGEALIWELVGPAS